jgi:protein O-mannosyl-transferase
MLKRKKSFKKHAPQARLGTAVPSGLNLHLLAGVAIIVVAVFTAYIPSINGGFIWDDELLITQNGLFKVSDGLYQIWCTTEATDYWPVINSMFWIEWRLWGNNPIGYHVVNLILHVVEALLIWLILRKLSIPGAFLAAVIFAVHPVNVESVAWIAQRKNAMAMLFLLLSILWYLKVSMPTASVGMAPAHSQVGSREREKTFSSFIFHPSSFHFWYWLSLSAFVMAMLSKGSVAVMPILLLGIVWWLRPLTWRDVLWTAPFFAVAAVLAAVNVWFQTHGLGEVIRTASFMERLLGAGSVVWFYLYKALLPIDLAFVYTQWKIEAGNPLWWAPLLAALAVTALLWMYRKGRGRPFLFAWGFFCVALVPVLGFNDVYFMRFSLVADHYQHIAIIGLIALAAAGWSVWRRPLRGATYWAASAIPIAAAGTLAFLTWQQSGLYRDEFTLFGDTLQKNPNCWLAHNNLGYILSLTGRRQEAIEHYMHALRLKPDYSDAHLNLGVALLETGRPLDAVGHLKESLRLLPNRADAHYNLGNALGALGQRQQSIEQYEKSLALEPDYYKAHNNLGSALVYGGRSREAMEHYQQALKLNPDNAEVYINLGLLMAIEGRLKEALEYYQQALRLNPNSAEAYNNLGLLMEKEGRLSEAIEHYQKALRFKPDFDTAYTNLASAYSKLGRPAEAIATAQKALEIARSRGQTQRIKEIEDGLNSYRAGLSSPPGSSINPPSKP